MTSQPYPPNEKQQQYHRKPMVLQDVLPELARQLDLDKQAAWLALIRLWKQALPEAFQPTAVAYGLETTAEGHSLLLVTVPHGALATELQMMGPGLCAHLNQYAAQTGVTLAGIQVSVGYRKGKLQ